MSAPARDHLEGLGLSSSCADVIRHLWDYLDDELTPDGAERLRVHIAGCPECHSYEVYQSCFLEAVKKLRTSLGASGPLRERLAEGLKEQGCGCWNTIRTDG